MKSTAPAPKGSVNASDVGISFDHPGPYLSLYLTIDTDTADAPTTNETRWRNLRRDAAEAGAPEALLAAVDPLVGAAHRHGRCLVVVGTEAGIDHVEYLAVPPASDLVRWAALPSLVGLIDWRQSTPAHVIVLADRIGADLVAVDRRLGERHVEAGGDDHPITKSAPGGWSQQRFQQRAENTWDKNAADVAKELATLAGQVDARVVVAAGDERAMQLLRDHLPDDVAEVLVEVEGSRAVDGGLSAIADDIVKAVDNAVAEDTVAFLRKFKEELGQADRAVQGPADVLTALAAGQVDVLLVHDDIDDDREAWFGDEPTQVAADRAGVEAMGATEPRSGRLVDVAVRAAFATSASVRVVPASAGGAGGLGALLRWAG